MVPCRSRALGRLPMLRRRSIASARSTPQPNQHPVRIRGAHFPTLSPARRRHRCGWLSRPRSPVSHFGAMRWQTKRGERFWAASSTSSRVMFGLAVFFLFAGVAILLDVPRATHPALWGLAIYAAMLGMTCVVYAFGTLKDLRLMPLAIALQIGSSVFAKW